MKKIQSLLIANRSEIAIRIMRAASELGIRTVALYSYEDRLALHRLKADESYLVGKGENPLDAYMNITDIIRIAKEAKVDAVHPGYGFLSENPYFAEACQHNHLIFIGPNHTTLGTLKNKTALRLSAETANVPILPERALLPKDSSTIHPIAEKIGYPLLIKTNSARHQKTGKWTVERASELDSQIELARKEAKSIFGTDEIYLEKPIERAKHIDVQIIGDLHGNIVHLFERDSSVQCHGQKILSRAPAPLLSENLKDEIFKAAIRLAQSVHLTHAGSLEFLIDTEKNNFYFIKARPSIQAEHSVTEQITGVDIVKSQIFISEGVEIGGAIPHQRDIKTNGHALQCRITTEDPENNFTPDYGRIAGYRSAAGFGIRLDAGTAYTNAIITPYYDPLLVKITAWAKDSDEALQRMRRALREFRIRGVSTNLLLLENIINHPLFVGGGNTTRFIDETPEIFRFDQRKDRASRLLAYIGDLIVNGHPEMRGRILPTRTYKRPLLPKAWPKPAPYTSTPNAQPSPYPPAGTPLDLTHPPPPGTRDLLLALGPTGLSQWILNQPRALITDTSMRDAHQSLFATRLRTVDMLRIAPYYARLVPRLFSLECWGGATFDVALRILKEDPWERLKKLRQAIPNILLQMLLRGSNAVGYTNYSDNVVKYFISRAAKGGVDLFRVFDSMNWVDNMRVAIDAVNEAGAICEGEICYSSDIFDLSRPKFSIKYYERLAKQLKDAGIQILGIKDMSGVCRPHAAKTLVRVLKEETGLPVRFHTHDTSGGTVASVLAAIEAGADIVDTAMDALSGFTAQPCMGTIVSALEGTDRAPQIDRNFIQAISRYWESIRPLYRPFEAESSYSTSDVFSHEIPGGLYTNLREQARASGLDHRWDEVSSAYSDVNKLFGDIIKVTPTANVVGDMALFAVANHLTPEQIMDPAKEIDFPASVVSLFKGDLGFPEDGFPEDISRRVLKCDFKNPILPNPPKPFRPGDHLPDTDLEKNQKELANRLGQAVDEYELASWLMYPKAFEEYIGFRRQHGDTSVLPTKLFFYGMLPHEETEVTLDPGKTLIIQLQGISAEDEKGCVSVFFELNGQARTVRIPKIRNRTGSHPIERPRAESGKPEQVGAPMAGVVVTIPVAVGQEVSAGSPLLSIDAVEMETLMRSEINGTVRKIHVSRGETVSAHDLLIELEPKTQDGF